MFTRYKERLNYTSDFDPQWVNPERAMAKFWQKIHLQNLTGSLPIEDILHTVLPAMATRWCLQDSDFFFRGRPYIGRDIALISTAVYWFATNVGNCFLMYPDGLYAPKRPDHEFLEKFTRYMKERRNLVAMWTHVCNNDCKLPSMPFADPHRDRPKEVTLRDYAVAEALMRWLGTLAGRNFIASWKDHIDRLESQARSRRTQALMQTA